MENSADKMVRKRRHLTPQEKYQIFLEATMAKAKGNGSISEVLRRWGIHSSDLTRIRASVEEGALGIFKERKSRRPKINLEQYEQLKAEKERLEATIVEQAAELAILKKRSLGLNGDLKGKYLPEETKGILVEFIDHVHKKHHVSITYCCQRIGLDIKRYQRWERLYRKTGRYEGGKPGPKKAPHRLLPNEKADIVKLAKDDKYMDLSHRQLSVVASESTPLEASASSFYRVMKEKRLMETRQRKPRTPQPKPEIKPEGPNEVWSWDLSYLALGPIFVYLFAIIDVYSRKIVGWHLGLNARLESMKKAWDKALVNENLVDVSEAPKLPTALSDHGVQMAKKTAKQFFKDLGIKQLFARYQTPQDNAWIESWFRILKYDWLRYKDYVSFDQLNEIIRRFVFVYIGDRIRRT
ncbi:MAG: IS3 family transposase [Deltaproteobacteria bacterium]|nr:IS3 family transposase [Deltaproteobacteria bacterium]